MRGLTSRNVGPRVPANELMHVFREIWPGLLLARSALSRAVAGQECDFVQGASHVVQRGANFRPRNPVCSFYVKKDLLNVVV